MQWMELVSGEGSSIIIFFLSTSRRPPLKLLHQPANGGAYY